MAQDKPKDSAEGRKHQTGGGGMPPREVERSGGFAPSETVPRERDKIGSAGDVQGRDTGPAIHGIPGAPPPGSVLGRERGLSKPPAEDEDEG